MIEDLKSVGAIKFGDFVLSSGKRSKIYIDIKVAATKPKILKRIADEMEKRISNIEFDKIACIELGGVPLAVALSLKTGKDLVIFRKQKKDYGVRDDKIGEINKGEKIVVVEDVVTTGKSVKSVIERVEKHGGRVVAVLAVVDREESDLDVISIMKLSEILEKLNKTLP